MSKIGRNQPCPCGSKIKYKHCCINKISSTEAQTVKKATIIKDNISTPCMDIFEDPDKLSNDSIDLITAGKLNEAEVMALKFIKQFPTLHDGLERMGTICEIRKDYVKAKEYYEQAANLIYGDDSGYDRELGDFMMEKADLVNKKINKK